MYQSFEVKNFRCFNALRLTDLKRINLIAGMNNVGKTALLEALFLHCGAYNPELSLRVNAFRGIEAVGVELTPWSGTPWDSLFYGFDTTNPVELVGEDTITGHRSLRLKVLSEPSELEPLMHLIHRDVGEGREEYGFGRSQPLFTEGIKVLQLEYQVENQQGSYYVILDRNGMRTRPLPPAPPFPASFQSARMRIPNKFVAEQFGRLESRGEQDVILQTLKLIEPRLERLTTVVVAGEPILHGKIKGVNRLMPLPIMGEGMVRLANLVLEIGNAPSGVVLVDEFENGIHHSVLPKVWRAIAEAARLFDTQIFATTHSLECIIAAHRAFSESGNYDFQLHRLERVDGDIRVVTYDQETLGAAIEMGLEVR